MMRSILGAVLCGAFLLVPSVLHGQVKAELTGGGGPVQILTKASGQPRGWPVSLSAKNVSSRRLLAVVLGIDLYAADGTLELKDSHIYSRVATSPGSWAPGASIPMTLPAITTAEGKPVARAKIWVDFALFADGSTRGPDRQGQGARVLAVREGANREVEHLRRLLHAGGIHAVQAALAAH